MQHYKTPAGDLYAIEPEFAQLLPEGCVEITDAEADQIREQAQAAHAQASRPATIRARLTAIDAESVRALRAASLARNKGQAVPANDAAKLEALEAEAANLRAELAGLA